MKMWGGADDLVRARWACGGHNMSWSIMSKSMMSGDGFLISFPNIFPLQNNSVILSFQRHACSWCNICLGAHRILQKEASRRGNRLLQTHHDHVRTKVLELIRFCCKPPWM